MIVFKTFLKVLNKCKGMVILYTAFLIFFSAFTMKTSDNSTNFVATKPDILIVNNDENKGITKNLIDYMDKNCKIKDIKDDEEAIRDALFYRDVNFIIYIPKNYRKDFLDKKEPIIEVKSTGDYNASLAKMMLERYIKIANMYINNDLTEKKLIKSINDTLAKETKVEITSKLDTDKLGKATYYFNFTNYCTLAGCIFVICMILSSFSDENIKKRTAISSMDYKKYNSYLLMSNCVFALAIWLLYGILSFILLGKIMCSIHGLLYIINSLVFTVCSVTIAFLIGNNVIDKNAIGGIVNVVALGSSFLCGAFVPMKFLPKSVLNIAHILPSYWFIKTNEIIKTVEEFNLDTMRPLLINMGVLVGFAIAFIIITNVITHKNNDNSN